MFITFCGLLIKLIDVCIYLLVSHISWKMNCEIFFMQIKTLLQKSLWQLKLKPFVDLPFSQVLCVNYNT